MSTSGKHRTNWDFSKMFRKRTGHHHMSAQRNPGGLCRPIGPGFERLENRLVLAPVIEIGDFLLSPDTAAQEIQIVVSGGDSVSGLNFYIQIDGGLGTDSPIFTGLDIVGAPSIFYNSNNGQYGDLLYPQIALASTDSPATVTADGPIGVVTLDATGWTSGTWHLIMSDTLNGPTDFAGTAATITDGTITVSTAPVANAGGNYEVIEGGSIQLDASGSYDPEAHFEFDGRWLDLDEIVTYEWDLDGDGVFGETGDGALQGDELGMTPTFSTAGLDDGIQTLSLRVYDTTGLVSTTATTQMSITNADPVITSVTVDSTVSENETVTLSGSFTDVGTLDTHTVLIDWGDGTAATAATVTQGSGSGTFTATHRYLDDAPTGSAFDVKNVTVTLNDDDGGSVADTSQTVRVNNVAPVITSVTVDSTVSENGTVTLNGSFTDVGTLDTHTVLIDWGDGTAATAATVTQGSGSGTFTATHRYLDDAPTGTAFDVKNVTVTLNDDDGGSVADTSQTVRVNNLAPVIASVTVDSTVSENGTVTLSGSFTDVGTLDTHTVLIDWGDGTAATAATVTQGSGSGTFTATHRYLDDAPTGSAFDVKNVTVTLNDDDGGSVADTSQTVRVNNLAPVITSVTVDSTVSENGTVTLNGSFTDVGTLDMHTVLIDWGDGTAATAATVTQGAGAGTFTATHQYLDDAPTGSAFDVKNVTVTLNDDDGGSVADTSQTVRVNNVAPVITSVTVDSTVSENGTVTLNGSFTDVGTLDTHTVLIDWGDGTAATAATVTQGSGSGTFTATHRYLDDAPTGTAFDVKNVTVTLNDDDGGSVADTSQTVRVNNLAPVITSVTVDSTVSENGTVTLSGSFTDAGTLDTHTVLIDWGDGTAATAATVTQGAGGGTFTATHRYLDDAPTGSAFDVKNVTVTLNDDDGGSVADTSQTVRVNNLAPVITSVTVDSTVSENGTVTFSGSFTDVGTLDTHTVLIDWGDGTAATAATVTQGSGSGTFTATHQYLDDTPSGTAYDVKNVTVTLNDDDGGSVTDTSQSVQVNNLAPVITSVTVDSTVSENGTVTLSGSFTDVGTLDTHTVLIDWGDGTAATAATVTQGAGSGTFTATHQYLDDAPTGTAYDVKNVTVTLNDDDGGSVADASQSVRVNNLAPVITSVTVDPTVSENGTVTLSGSFTDAGTLDTHTVLIDWGDGTAATAATVTQGAGSGTFTATHQYLDDTPSGTAYDVKNVTVTLNDDDGGSVADTSQTVQVNNLAPEITSVTRAPSFGRKDEPIELTVLFTDAGTIDTHTVTIHWGEGTPEEVAVTPGARDILVSHVYTADGVYSVTVTVSDDDIASDSLSFTITVKSAEVVDRHIFYNNSYFDGNDAGASTADFAAIAPHTTISETEEPDKELGKDALLPGETATLANYTSYSRGINGIMVDISGLAGTPTADDFTFRVGNDSNPDSWTIAPAPLSVTVWAGAGTDGSDRITIIWADNAIEKQWLQVTVEATAATGLAEADVFYFGNAIADTGDSSSNAFVNATDAVGVRDNPHNRVVNPAPVYDAYDFNRDAKVDATDAVLVRNNATNFLTALKLISVPAIEGNGQMAEAVTELALQAEALAVTDDVDPQVLEVNNVGLSVATVAQTTVTSNTDSSSSTSVMLTSMATESRASQTGFSPIRPSEPFYIAAACATQQETTTDSMLAALDRTFGDADIQQAEGSEAPIVSLPSSATPTTEGLRVSNAAITWLSDRRPEVSRLWAERLTWLDELESWDLQSHNSPEGLQEQVIDDFFAEYSPSISTLQGKP